MIVDILNETQRFQTVTPQLIAASVTGSAADMSPCMAASAALIDIGAAAGTTPKVGFQFEESADLVTWTILQGETQLNGVVVTALGPCTVTTVTTSNQQIEFRALRTYQYARINITTTAGSATPSFGFNGKIIAQKKFVAQTGKQGGYSNMPATSS